MEMPVGPEKLNVSVILQESVANLRFAVRPLPVSEWRNRLNGRMKGILRGPQCHLANRRHESWRKIDVSQVVRPWCEIAEFDGTLVNDPCLCKERLERPLA